MTKVAPINQRKADHIKINLERDVRSALTTGLEKFHFVHEALPDLNLDEVDTTLSVARAEVDVLGMGRTSSPLTVTGKPLDAEERADLILALLQRTVEQALAATRLAGVVVVSQARTPAVPRQPARGD